MKHRSIPLLAVLAALALLLIGCAAGSTSDKSEAYPGDIGNGSAGMDGAPSQGEAALPDDMSGEFERKIIRTVTMSCESKEYDSAVAVIMNALTTHGGYVEASSSSGGGARSVAYTQSARFASYTMRVPAEELDAFLESLRTNGTLHITEQSISSGDITGTYYDTKTRLETLTAEKDALTTMLAGFIDYSDISAMLEVQERLYDVIEEIESLQTRLNLYDSQVSMSTVTLTLHEVIEYTVIENPTFGERISEAFFASWSNFGMGCQNFAVWFVEAFPTLLLLAAIATAATVVLTRQARKRKNRKKQ